MTNEEIYDSEIAPVLLALGKRCEEVGISFVAHVEWEPGKNGRTETLQVEASFSQRLVHWAARCGGNIDSLIWAIKKHAKTHGHSSVELRRMEIRATA
jgi:hypothetical protein